MIVPTKVVLNIVIMDKKDNKGDEKKAQVPPKRGEFGESIRGKEK